MRDKIKMQSSASPHFRTATKNKRKTPNKLKKKMYDPIVRKHVEYEETKIK
jgi:large subunit ribosomal protein L33